MKAERLRVELDGRNEKVNLKIREAIGRKIPYMLIVGDREAANRTVSVRTRDEGDVGTRDVSEFTGELEARIESRT